MSACGPVHPHFCLDGHAALQIGAVACHEAPALSHARDEHYYVWRAGGDGEAHGHLPAPLRLAGPTAVFLDGACVGHVDAAGARPHDAGVGLHPVYADGALTELTISVKRAPPLSYHRVQAGEPVSSLAVGDGYVVVYGRPSAGRTSGAGAPLRALVVHGPRDAAAWWATNRAKYYVKPA